MAKRNFFILFVFNFCELIFVFFIGRYSFVAEYWRGETIFFYFFLNASKRKHINIIDTARAKKSRLFL